MIKLILGIVLILGSILAIGYNRHPISFEVKTTADDYRCLNTGGLIFITSSGRAFCIY